MNVYAKSSIADKRRLWGELVMSKRGFGGDVWCMLGDFNVVCYPSKTRGIGGVQEAGDDVECQEFRGFIDEM